MRYLTNIDGLVQAHENEGRAKNYLRLMVALASTQNCSLYKHSEGEDHLTFHLRKNGKTVNICKYYRAVN